MVGGKVEESSCSKIMQVAESTNIFVIIHTSLEEGISVAFVAADGL
jgi:hypothetical protein